MVRVLAKLILLFVLVYTGVSIWYGRVEERLLQQPVVAEKPVEESAPEKTEVLRQPDDYTIIVKRNIFQAAITKKEPVKEEVVETKLEPTKLKLSLMGTISGNERDARAIISDDAKRVQDIYQVGDSIQGGLIKSIERGKVVLSVNNRDEILTLKDREGGGPAYQPAPDDFYNEPPEPQPVAQENDQQGLQQQRQGQQLQPRRTVRPRPVRRPTRTQPTQRPTRVTPNSSVQ